MTDYSKSGVDIEAGDNLAEFIKRETEVFNLKGVIEGVGGFCALHQFGWRDDNFLATSTDGVGTKIKFGQEAQNLFPIGIDLVAMVVNDLITCGASPLFLLDYISISNLKAREHEVRQLLRGIFEGCRKSDCSLIGGETAEMTAIYGDDYLDVAAFGVGSVLKTSFLGPHNVEEGDVILGVASSGVHSNGFSLLHKIGFNHPTLLTPTKIYVPLIRHIQFGSYDIHAAAHITGGGLEHNVSRVVPDGLKAKIDWDSWERPSVFDAIQYNGKIEEEEMRRVFNCGVGFAIICPSFYAPFIQHPEFNIFKIGEIILA